MKQWYLKSIKSDTLTLLPFPRLDSGATSHFKLPRNRKRECPACFKQEKSDMLKTNCKIKHGMGDDQINTIKNYSFKYYKKHFVVTMNCSVNQENLVI